ncbi:MAG: hypothetical protein OEZ20_08910 [candidate division WOR-3 bacterium]|nr:hypothetical protein [candidate division WOR-3 bacterium]
MVTYGEKAKIQKAVTVYAFKHIFAFTLKVEQIFSSSISPIGRISELGSFITKLGEMPTGRGNHNETDGIAKSG